ncbi:MAG: VapC toxin family PIN domain ribonuclease [Aquificaceae bacterium]|nr:MAG: VapC toxin family PIN domain ribonuclease [Aquificaceae bacterium]
MLVLQQHYIVGVLDTNICIYVLKERPASVLKAFESVKSLHISSIVYSELWVGIENSPVTLQDKRREQLIQFLSLLTTHDWDESAGEEYARLYIKLKRKRMMIGNMDLLIATHAKSLGATLVTNNIKEFERIEDLKIENWV